MDILVLGGTQFVGRHMVQEALTRGHRLTLFNRGTKAGLFDVEERVGDRDGDLSALETGKWDAVIDTSGYVPRHVELSADLLKDRCETYCFISTISVYEDLLKPLQDSVITESSPLLELAEPTEEVNAETYGALKVLCEEAVADIVPSKHLILRPGFIVGPYDHTDRFSYWVHRVAQGGEMLVPGEPATPIQYVDVRDLASWTIDCLEAKTRGRYNTVVPPQRYTMADMLQAAKEISGSDARFSWVSERFLTEHEVGAPDLPIWPPKAYRNFVNVSSEAALSSGFSVRTIAETVRATHAYLQSLGEAYEIKEGLKLEREKQLLSLWQQETPPRGKAG